MSRPLFSVLVPTRDRPDTLRHTLATVVNQGREDYEIVVADNCGSPETRRVVEELGSPLVRYTRSEEVLPMAANWERGLALCSGEYITVLGDDDAFLPSTLALAEKLIRVTGAEILSWRPHVYWWPDTIAYWVRSRLFIEFGNGASWIKSRKTLEGFYAGSRGFSEIPAIYWSFFHRNIIDEGRRRHGAFFVPVDAPPDISSGILGLHLTQRYAQSSRALSIRGNSGKSNGTAQWMRSLGNEQREKYYREERVGMRGMVHDSMVPSPNLIIFVASTKLKCKERYFPDDPLLGVNLEQVVRILLANLNLDPEAYEENLSDTLALASKIGMRVDPSAIPPKAPLERVPQRGPLAKDDGMIGGLAVDCDLVRVQNVADAASLAESLMPPVESYLEGGHGKARDRGFESYASSFPETETASRAEPGGWRAWLRRRA